MAKKDKKKQTCKDDQKKILWKRYPRGSGIFPLSVILIFLPGPWHSSCGLSETFIRLFATELGKKYQQRPEREWKLISSYKKQENKSQERAPHGLRQEEEQRGAF